MKNYQIELEMFAFKIKLAIVESLTIQDLQEFIESLIDQIRQTNQFYFSLQSPPDKTKLKLFFPSEKKYLNDKQQLISNILRSYQNCIPKLQLCLEENSAPQNKIQDKQQDDCKEITIVITVTCGQQKLNLQISPDSSLDALFAQILQYLEIEGQYEMFHKNQNISFKAHQTISEVGITNNSHIELKKSSENKSSLQKELMPVSNFYEKMEFKKVVNSETYQIQLKVVIQDGSQSHSIQIPISTKDILQQLADQILTYIGRTKDSAFVDLIYEGRIYQGYQYQLRLEELNLRQDNLNLQAKIRYNGGCMNRVDYKFQKFIF